METEKYLKILVEDIHSTIVATLDSNNRPVTRCIDMMLYDQNGVYFLTATGKQFYQQLTEQKYVSLSGIKDKRCISLSGKVKNIGKEKLDEIFEKDPYMKDLYPGETRSALEVFWIYEADGKCLTVCPQKCIDVSKKPALIDQNGCLHCGNCVPVCPVHAISRKSL